MIVFPEGFICFDDEDPPELVLWISDEEAQTEAFVIDATRAFETIARVLSFAEIDPEAQAMALSLAFGSRSLRIVPDTEPFDFRPAASWFFEIAGRIPTPQVYGDVQRYPRQAPGVLFDFPVSPWDATRLLVPEK